MKNFEKYKADVYDAIAVSRSDKLLDYAGIEYNGNYRWKYKND